MRRPSSRLDLVRVAFHLAEVGAESPIESRRGRDTVVRSQNRIRSTARRYVAVNRRRARFRRDATGRLPARFSRTPTETVRADAGPSILGIAWLGEDCSPVRIVGDADPDYPGERSGCREVLRRCAPGIPMMEAAHSGV